jgi:site-specific DNA recombinase
LIFDDRGNAMSPSHANKKGVRYRYYVSQALLQSRKSEVGSVARVSAPEVEEAVCRSLRARLQTDEETCDRDLVARCAQRVVVKADRIIVDLRDEQPTGSGPNGSQAIEIPFTPNGSIRKGIERTPHAAGRIDPEERDALLQAVVRARRWIEAILTDAASSFETIAASEGLGERHVRRLAPLAFLSPRILQAIADGTAPSGLTVSSLTLALPHDWGAQERMVGLGYLVSTRRNVPAGLRLGRIKHFRWG